MIYIFPDFSFRMAPEVVMCETVKDSPYDYMADIWSFGKSRLTGIFSFISFKRCGIFFGLAKNINPTWLQPKVCNPAQKPVAPSKNMLPASLH